MTSFSVEEVVPGSILWPSYLQMTFVYMQESWPDRVSQGTKAFYREYGDILRERSADSGRALFIYNLDKQPVGLANVYLQDNKLNIAEFYLVQTYRGRGIGRKMLEHIVGWGEMQGADIISIEVDKDLQVANAFWNKFDFALDTSGTRNIYSCKIATNPKLKNKI